MPLLSSLSLAGLLAFAMPAPSHAAQDTDGDGLIDAFEAHIGTDINKKDTDGDGLSDEVEVRYGYDPRVKGKKPLKVSLYTQDTDGDGLSDLQEMNIGSDYSRVDSDGDGYHDGEEVLHGYSPLSSDPTKYEKLIEVSIASQELSYYIGNIKIASFKISSGKPGWDTPKGNFNVIKKLPVVHYKGEGYDFPNTKWNLMFKFHGKGSYYVHGAYWHDKFGTRRSHGCVNVHYRDMEQLYAWADEGTRVILR